MIKKVKEYIKNKRNYKNWLNTGLLSGLSEEESVALAEKLDEAVDLMLKGQASVLDTLIIPIIARCYHKHKYLVKDVKAVKAHLEKRLFLLHELISTRFSGMDAEAEFCDVMASEIYALKL